MVSRKKTNGILAVYLKKKRVYINLTRICECGGLKVLVVKFCIYIDRYMESNVASIIRENRKRYYKKLKPD